MDTQTNNDPSSAPRLDSGQFHDRPTLVTPRTVLGIAVALLGLVLMLDRLGLAEAHRLLQYWPVPLIIMGGLMIVQGQDGRDRTRGFIFAGIGTWFFLNNEGLLSVRIWDLLWPLILMLIGISLVFRTGGPRRRYGRRYRRRYGYDGPPDSNAPFGQAPSPPAGAGTPASGFRSQSTSAAPGGSVASFGPADANRTVADASTAAIPPYADRFERISIFAMWSSVRRTSVASPFRGGDITAIMGGSQLDLRMATIPPGEEAVLDIVAVMGGVELLVPSNWEVSTPIMPFMGGVEDKRLPTLPNDPNAGRQAGRLVLHGLVMMGGVHIKN